MFCHLVVIYNFNTFTRSNVSNQGKRSRYGHRSRSNVWCIAVYIRGSACRVQQMAITLRFGAKDGHYQSKGLFCVSPCRQAVPTSTTLPIPATQGKCCTVSLVNYHWPALHFYEQYLECNGIQKTAYFQCGIRPKEGDTQASAKESGNKPIISAVLPLRCLPTWVCNQEA